MSTPLPSHESVARDRLLPRRLAWIVPGALVMVVVGGLIGWKAWDDRRVEQEASTARRLVALGRFDEARPALRRWLDARPDSAEAVFLVARAALALGLAEEGFQGLERARALGYSPDGIDRERALALSRMGRHAEAEPTLKVLAAKTRPPDPHIEEALARGYMATFQLRAAAEAIERWLQVAPEDPRPYLWRAQVGLRTNASVEQLVGDYETALALDSESREARLGLAQQRLDRLQLDEARRHFEELLKRVPDDPEAMLGLGRALDGLGQAEEAARLLERAAVLSPKSVQPLLEMARIALRRGRNIEALELLDRAIQLDESEPELHYQRSLALARLGRADEARAERERTTQLRAEHEQIGKILLDLNAHPDDVERKLDAARWLFAHNHPEEAIRWAQMILSAQPYHREANAMMGDYYDRVGDAGMANFYRLKLGSPVTRAAENPERSGND